MRGNPMTSTVRTAAAVLIALYLGHSSIAQEQEGQGAVPPEQGTAAPEQEATTPAPEATTQEQEPGATAQEQGGEAAAPEHEEEATPHYPLLHPRHVHWSFSGPFGKFEPQQLQRGFQVYRDVCAACHSLSLIAFRNLASETGPHFSEEEASALAAEYAVVDPSVEGGERPGRASDYLPEAPPYPGSTPPDLSLLAKARAISRGFPTYIFDLFTQYQETGPDYIYSLLTGYQEPPPGVEVPEGQYYNPYFVSGAFIAMPPPLSDGLVAYAQNQDETEVNNVPETVDQYAKDVTAFLAWAAEPHMVDRKAMGLTVMIFLIVLAGLVYYTKKRVWAEAY
jgi:ubiquinol-cytochrome c reductase cytochrome c1 subunit